jgi:uncharacterized protein YggU (UPF0235/DUF167 family)
VTGSARVQLRVSPGAARPAVVGRYGTGWKVRVAAVPEKGRANVEVVRLLARALDVPERSLSIVAGKQSQDKVLAVAGLDADEADRRLAAAVVGRDGRSSSGV